MKSLKSQSYLTEKSVSYENQHHNLINAIFPRTVTYLHTKLAQLPFNRNSTASLVHVLLIYFTLGLMLSAFCLFISSTPSVWTLAWLWTVTTLRRVAYWNDSSSETAFSSCFSRIQTSFFIWFKFCFSTRWDFLKLVGEVSPVLLKTFECSSVEDSWDPPKA